VHTPHAPARSNVSAARVMRVPSLLEKKDTRAELQWEIEVHIHTYVGCICMVMEKMLLLWERGEPMGER
jgi:hypothetical protein